MRSKAASPARASRSRRPKRWRGRYSKGIASEQNDDEANCHAGGHREPNRARRSRGARKQENEMTENLESPSEPIRVVVFADFVCPYSFLAVDQIDRLAREYDVKPLWRPHWLH